jgi:deoxyribodipyrimidine photo-lyase
MGPHRARFWRESVTALRERLRGLGGELLIRIGPPERIVPAVAEAFGADVVHVHEEVTDEERRREAAVREVLENAGRRLRTASGSTLIHRDDLPFPVSELPDVFTQFRRAVEKSWVVRSPHPAPDRVPTPVIEEPGAVPTLAQMGVDDRPVDPRTVMRFVGGETEGERRLAAYLFDADALRSYKETRNGLLRTDDSTKLSPWLALGCVSPRRVVAEVERYEEERVRNESTYWLVFELLWRDYFKFLALREGPSLFRQGGVGRRRRDWRTDREAFRAWVEGRTGYPFVDAFMRELAATGFMSNRGRQNAASFLAKTLGIDWRWGASHFEAELVDYDPASNWGNWQYVAGVGTDPRDRVFNVVKQARDYDPDGAFTRRWVPELGAADPHTPWLDPPADYPPPCVDPARAFEPKRRGKRRRR